MDELELDRLYKRGDRGKNVRAIQEWLSLHGFQVKIDGEFGPATESAVKQFQNRRGISAKGVVNDATFHEMVAPIEAAVAELKPNGKSLGALTVAYARQHLAQHPREIGGQNRGPWVRLYMKGHEGEEWAWCAGFACFCLKQACESLAAKMPIVPSFSCDSLASSAKTENRFLRAPERADRAKLTPGSFFLSRRTNTDWTHTGIVVRADQDVFQTIEGNTNDDGSREGFEVCARTRGYGQMDFILI